MNLDIETLRRWVNSQKGRWPVISTATNYPYYSLQKFADGRTKEPRLAKLIALTNYMQKNKKKAA